MDFIFFLIKQHSEFLRFCFVIFVWLSMTTIVAWITGIAEQLEGDDTAVAPLIIIAAVFFFAAVGLDSWLFN